MLLKLSLSSMRKMFKDYLVLLFGLTISIAIFYMFETLAQNQAFIESNSMISAIVFVFHVGTFILGAITVFYIFYATSFILTLRQKEMGMYMTLGAKKHKVTQLMFFETFFIGIVSLMIGLTVGVGLAKGIAELFMWQLDFSGEGFEALYPPSMITTIIFYVVLFFLTSIVNAGKIARKSVLNLLHAEQKQDHVKVKGKKTFIGVVLAVILIGVGYYAMINMGQLEHYGLILAAITIVPGTYLMFISFLPWFVKKLKGNRSLNEKGLNSFTLGQLRFRMLNLTKVLGTVAMLIAMGLGAMTAGISFYHNVELQASAFYANDAAIHQPTEEDETALANMNITEQNTYHYKVNDQGVYFLKEDLLENPPMIKQVDPTSMEIPEGTRISESLPEAKYKFEELPDAWSTALSMEMNASSSMFGGKSIYVVDKGNYHDISADETSVELLQVDNFTAHLSQFETISENQQELAENYRGEGAETIPGKYGNYVGFKAISSGTIFMGIFLGVAFLMMMASVLMFKLLSTATTDTHRYSMLRKIGVRKSLLVKSIYRELFLLFLFPALVGLVHVLIGMQMFSFIIIEPYTKIWMPISIFLVIYGLYFWITVKMYKRIVLPKEA
ncbi:putative ABC transport system permease protein [Lentibacillus halodurans]|uniref:Putative ABC transport system permease protein n=1 Tax=Lentibacillus halodurans TaxID=237679 RepID=A0A1I0X687_9BACI|nr:ABC transporter permease [Lentibacillus halodurans]SFA96505.1 putative ABC transport system permease protein [Lentibacillus halodurans]